MSFSTSYFSPYVLRFSLILSSHYTLLLTACSPMSYTSPYFSTYVLTSPYFSSPVLPSSAYFSPPVLIYFFLLFSSLFFSSPYFTFFLYFHHLNIFLLLFLFYSSSFIYNSILPCFLTSLRNSPGSSFPTSSLPGRVTQSVNILVRVHSPYSQPIHLSIY